MIHAYDRTYLEKARVALARMLDFAVYDLHYDLSTFFDFFLASGVATLFEQGDIHTLVGQSGVELAYNVLERCKIPFERVIPQYTANRSEEYWTGWALAYYQWETALSFSEIVACVPIQEIMHLYDPYHEMDIQQFADHMNEQMRRMQRETNLKWMRQQLHMSQKQLSEISQVPLRTIQQYEQRQKDINKAQGIYLLMLAQALYCRPEQLIEHFYP